MASALPRERNRGSVWSRSYAQLRISGTVFGLSSDGKPGRRNFAGKVSMFRWYAQDPIRFSKSILWSIEHGHANNFENDYSSVVYWYQLEPHKPFPDLLPPEKRIP